METSGRARCPECHSLIGRVITTRWTDDMTHLVRRRCCCTCDHRWYTIQPVEQEISSYHIIRKKHPVHKEVIIIKQP